LPACRTSHLLGSGIPAPPTDEVYSPKIDGQQLIQIILPDVLSI
jgi:hypothetical protein